jgi:tyrosine-protein kinase Etk/Wzc
MSLDPNVIPQSAVAAGVSEQSEEISLVDLLMIFAENKKLLIAAPSLVGLITLGATFVLPPTYTASAQILPPQQQSGAMAALIGSIGGVAGALGGGLSGLKNPSDQWVAMLKSRTVADEIVKRFDLKTVYESDLNELARRKLESNSKVSAGKDGLIDIEVDDEDPERAAGLARAYIDELQKMMNSLAVTDAAQRRLFFEKQLNEAKSNLIQAEILLKEGAINASVLKASPDVAVAQLAQAQAAVAAQEVKLKTMSSGMTASHPEYQQAQRELDGLKIQLRLIEQENPAQARTKGAEYITRYREFKYQETLFELFARQYELARADEARDGSLIQVVDEPQVPERRSKPKRMLTTVLATAIGFIGACLFIMVRRSFFNYGQGAKGHGKLLRLRQQLSWRSS